VLVRARMLAEPGYDQWVRGTSDPAGRFADEVGRTHRRTNRFVDETGTWTLPWPRPLGTQPWAVARELLGQYRVRPVLDRAAAWTRLVQAASPAPLYVGDHLLPRHVVLVTASSGEDRLQVYEPSAGASLTVHRRLFLDARLRLAGWDRPWFTVTPR